MPLGERISYFPANIIKYFMALDNRQFYGNSKASQTHIHTIFLKLLKHITLLNSVRWFLLHFFHHSQRFQFNFFVTFWLSFFLSFFFIFNLIKLSHLGGYMLCSFNKIQFIFMWFCWVYLYTHLYFCQYWFQFSEGCVYWQDVCLASQLIVLLFWLVKITLQKIANFSIPC